MSSYLIQTYLKQINQFFDEKKRKIKSNSNLQELTMINCMARSLKNFDRLKKQIFDWHSFRYGKSPTESDRSTLVKFIKQQQYYQEVVQFDPTSRMQNVTKYEHIIKLKQEQQVLQRLKLFDTPIQVRCGQGFIQKLSTKQINDQQINMIFIDMYMIASGVFIPQAVIQGDIGYVKQIPYQCQPFRRYFTIKSIKSYAILFQIGIEKKPIFSKTNSILSFQYHTIIVFEDFIKKSHLHDIQKIRQIIRKIDTKQNLWRSHEKGQLIPKLNQNLKEKYLFECYKFNPQRPNDKLTENIKLTQQIQTFNFLQFEERALTQEETNKWIFNEQEISWKFKKEQKRIMGRQTQDIIENEILNRFIDFRKAQRLVSLIESIPNFKMPLTEQEKHVIGKQGNILVIGRSGTGKTTCAILRLFAIEILFKKGLLQHNRKFKNIKTNLEITSQDINNTIGMRSVFLTASFYLIQQIKRHYQSMTNLVKSQIDKKRQLQKQRKRWQEPQSIDQSILSLNPEKTFIGVPQKQNKNESIFKQQDDNLQERIEQAQQKANQICSLFDLSDKDFPGFFTVKKFVTMIDGTIKNPFYSRKQKDKQNLMTGYKGVQQVKIQNFKHKKQQIQSDSDQFQDQIDDQFQIQENDIFSQLNRLNKQKNEEAQRIKKEKQQKLNKKRQAFQSSKAAYQITYEVFVNEYWTKLEKKRINLKKIMPLTVWGQIFSTIKGSAISHTFPNRYIPQQIYLKEKSSTFLTFQDKEIIYKLFLTYQNLKNSSGNFDFMDVVNHVLSSISLQGYKGPQIHYLMIDQVQDLPQAAIYLLSKIISHKLFFSGDSAQAIAKGVSFKFTDLKKIFHKENIKDYIQKEAPQQQQLTVSFRSQNNILQLANSIICCIQKFFPKTIDKLQKQSSQVKGPKPILIKNKIQDLLQYILCGQEANVDRRGFRPEIQFGCEQVIIVRNQKYKSKIPSSLSHALCLTIQQSKGLQFDDVVAYDFFSTSPCPSQWSLFKHIKINNQESKIDQKIEKEITLDGQQLENFQELCTELKMLYTMITRARNSFIIYDDNTSHQKYLEKLWIQLDLVNVINDFNDYCIQSNGDFPTEQKINLNSADRWKRQGLKMYVRGIYSQAIKCFQKCGEQKLQKKTKAKMYANQAAKQQKALQIKKKNQKIVGDKRNKELKLFEQKQNQILYKFRQAGKLFKEIGKNKEAGQCFYSCNQFQEAFQCFIKQKMIYQAGQCKSQLGQYQQASKYFFDCKKYSKGVQNLGYGKMFKKALQMVQRFQNFLSYEQKSYFLRKFTSSIFRQVSNNIKQIYNLNEFGQWEKQIKFNERPQFQDILLDDQADQDNKSIEFNQEQQKKNITTINRTTINNFKDQIQIKTQTKIQIKIIKNIYYKQIC